jgi:hypothetical protein
VLVGVGAQGRSLPVLALVFAVKSLGARIVLRRVVGMKEGQVMVWDRDINR